MALTQNQKLEILSLVKSGMTYQDVANQYQVSRSSVAGMIFRANLKKTFKEPKKPKIRKAKIKLELPDKTDMIGITIFDLTHKTCAYTADGKIYCGRPVKARSFCEECYKICIQPRRKKCNNTQ